jgi:hypothetical protein
MKRINHADYQAACTRKSVAELQYAIQDAAAAAAAQPEGVNAGYYLDEVNYCAAELRRRLGV